MPVALKNNIYSHRSITTKNLTTNHHKPPKQKVVKTPSKSSSSGGDEKLLEIDSPIENKYQIIKRLGKGAYGIVWEAIENETGKKIALKKIFDAFRNDTDAQRTYREIYFLLAFGSHKNIISLINAHRAQNDLDFYLTFPLMNTDLHKLVKTDPNSLTEEKIRWIVYEICKAVLYIHSADVIHRDIKPANILLDDPNLRIVKLGDFGLARSMGSITRNNGEGHPEMTDYVATRWYRPPEILLNCRKYTKAVDIWSIGCIIGEMVKKAALFPAANTVEQVGLVLSIIDPPSRTELNSISSEAMKSVAETAIKIRKPGLTEIFKDEDPAILDLMERILRFNPEKRPTIEHVISHPLLKWERCISEEIRMNRPITPPLNDNRNFCLAVYRSKLYEMVKTGDLIFPEFQQKVDTIGPGGDAPHQSGKSLRVTSGVVFEMNEKIVNFPWEKMKVNILEQKKNTQIQLEDSLVIKKKKPHKKHEHEMINISPKLRMDTAPPKLHHPVQRNKNNDLIKIESKVKSDRSKRKEPKAKISRKEPPLTKSKVKESFFDVENPKIMDNFRISDANFVEKSRKPPKIPLSKSRITKAGTTLLYKINETRKLLKDPPIPPPTRTFTPPTREYLTYVDEIQPPRSRGSRPVSKNFEYRCGSSELSGRTRYQGYEPQNSGRIINSPTYLPQRQTSKWSQAILKIPEKNPWNSKEKLNHSSYFSNDDEKIPQRARIASKIPSSSSKASDFTDDRKKSKARPNFSIQRLNSRRYDNYTQDHGTITSKELEELRNTFSRNVVSRR